MTVLWTIAAISAAISSTVQSHHVYGDVPVA